MTYWTDRKYFSHLITYLTIPSGTTTYSFDALNRLTYLENRKATGEVISSYRYTLEPAGNRTKVEENSGRVVNYAYDRLYRLIREEITDPVNGNETISYSYDAFGNRLSKTDSHGTVAYSYDANDRMLTDGTAAYSYDNNGSTVAKSDGSQIITYGFDSENRLIAVHKDGSLIRYAYDSDGIRVSSAVDGNMTKYLVDKNQPYAQVLEERGANNVLAAAYVYGDDLISQNRGSNSYYQYDGQLSVRQLTNAGGNVTDKYAYEAYGNVLFQSGVTENNYLYTGEQFDPNLGFYYLRARYYDHGVGRFVSTDPYQGRIFEPATLQNYIYANANPVMFRDPSGFMSLIEVFTVMGMEDKLREAEFVKKVDSTRKKFRHYCRNVAKYADYLIGEYKHIKKLTKGTKRAGHHILQDSEMYKNYTIMLYSKGIGMAMPVLGKRGNQFSPHWIMNQVQRNNKDSKGIIEVAELALNAAGCEEKDTDKIIEFVLDSYEVLGYWSRLH